MHRQMKFAVVLSIAWSAFVLWEHAEVHAMARASVAAVEDMLGLRDDSEMDERFARMVAVIERIQRSQQGEMPHIGDLQTQSLQLLVSPSRTGLYVMSQKDPPSFIGLFSIAMPADLRFEPCELLRIAKDSLVFWERFSMDERPIIMGTGADAQIRLQPGSFESLRKLCLRLHKQRGRVALSFAKPRELRLL
jgi:hypothetical protein